MRDFGVRLSGEPREILQWKACSLKFLPADGEVRQIFRVFDIDGSGEIDYRYEN